MFGVRMMKRHYWLLLPLLLQIILGAPIHANGLIRFGVYQNAPLVFTDDRGEARGLVIDVLEYVAAQEGWQIEYVSCEWANCLEQAGVVNRLFASQHAREYNVRQTAIIFNPIEVRYATAKGAHPELLAALDTHLQALKADEDSIYYQSLDHWFGITDRRGMPLWIRWTVLIFGALLIILGVTTLALRVKVRTRTQELQAEVLEHKKAEDALRRRTQELATLNQIGQALSRLAPIDEILHLIYTAIGQVLDNKNLYIALYHEEEGELSFPVYTIEGQYQVPNRRRPFGDGLTEYVIRNKAPLCILSDMEATLTKLGIDTIGRPSRSLLAVPMLLGEKVLGVITLQDYQNENAYTPEDVDLLFNIATQAAIAIENAHLHDAVRRHAAELEQRVAERTRELQAAQDQLVRQEKLAVLGQLAGGVGHELRNPLGVIANAVYLLKMIQEDADKTVHEYLELIEIETRNAVQIISSLLDFARVKAVEREQITVARLIAQALERQPPPEGSDVHIDIPPDLPPVFIDPQQIELVLTNLIANAYQAMPDGGQLTIHAEVPDDQSAVNRGQGSTSNPQSLVSISIADTGCGIPPENMDKLFEPLFTTKLRGIGLGLAIAKNLVEANGGHIEVKSQEGQGSTFTVYLPVFSHHQSPIPDT